LQKSTKTLYFGSWEYFASCSARLGVLMHVSGVMGLHDENSTFMKI